FTPAYVRVGSCDPLPSPASHGQERAFVGCISKCGNSGRVLALEAVVGPSDCAPGSASLWCRLNLQPEILSAPPDPHTGCVSASRLRLVRQPRKLSLVRHLLHSFVTSLLPTSTSYL